MNILILSCGTRNKIIQYFKKTINGNVVAADMQPTAPALYEADVPYIVPPITDPGYIDEILLICRKERINGVLSLIDPELSLLAANAEKFEAIGVKVIGSSYELCERALDKMSMYSWLNAHHYSCARSYIDPRQFYADLEEGKIAFPVFVKPIKGSASLMINKVEDKKTLEVLLAHNEGLMIQEYLLGREIGADVYVDMISGEVVSVFAKEKLRMRAGETDKSVSIKSQTLFDLIVKFVRESGWRGPIDMDVFEVDGEFFISEVNPRFGGGYPHAFECGCNFMKMIENNMEGRINEGQIGDYEDGVCMMKYTEVKVLKDDLCTV